MHVQEAQAAKQHTQGYNLDKRHAFQVTMFDEFDKFLKISDSYEQPENKEYEATENLQVSTTSVPCVHKQATIHTPVLSLVKFFVMWLYSVHNAKRSLGLQRCG